MNSPQQLTVTPEEGKARPCPLLGLWRSEARLWRIGLFLLGAFAVLTAAAQRDTLTPRELKTADVTVRRKAPGIRRTDDGAYRWDLKMMGSLPQILGNADPLHYTQLLPGVQTAAEYDAGLHVQGCDNGHNAVSIEGVTVYNPSHALGLFSTFNSTHFPAMTFALSPRRGAAPSRLGGSLSMHLPDSLPLRTSGELSVGPMAVQGTLRLRLGTQTALFVSGRGSFLNLCYGELLKVDGSQLDYDLGDANVTLLHDNGRDRFRLNLYTGIDDLGMAEGDYQARASLLWTNRLVSAEWLRRGRWADFRQTLFYTGYANRFRLRQTSIDFLLDSDVNDLGFRSEARVGENWNVGIEAAMHRVRPQRPRLTGDYAQNEAPEILQKAGELAAFADYRLRLLPRLDAHLGLRAAIYDAPGGGLFARPMPSVELVSRAGDFRYRLGWSYREQFLFQTGFSNMGLPTEFWFAADRQRRPQTAHSLNAAVEGRFGGGDYAFAVEAYWKRLRRQVEYDGTLLDFLTTRYELDRVLRTGRGENFGFSLTLRKDRGRLTGWVAYSFGRARRTYADEETGSGERTFSANHERPHELNAVATWQVARRWKLGATFVFASGTPFTAPKHFYLLNGKIFSDFSKRNSSRLRPYRRLDLSASLRLGRLTGPEQGLNLSIYNATATGNDLFYRLKLYKGRFSYRPLRFLVKVLPSVSYYVRF